MTDRESTLEQMVKNQAVMIAGMREALEKVESRMPGVFLFVAAALRVTDKIPVQAAECAPTTAIMDVVGKPAEQGCANPPTGARVPDGSERDAMREALDCAKMAKTRLNDFADKANAGTVHYSARELKRRVWASFGDFDRASAALTARVTEPGPPWWNRRERDEIQKTVIEWGTRAFGADHMADKIVRAARFIEEAAELVQAVGLPKDHALRALDYVYSRPAGDPAQEMGGVSNTQYALAGALRLSVATCEAAEIGRCLTKDPAHFAQRNRDKIEKIDAARVTDGSEGGDAK